MSDKKRGMLFILSGPSGSGKDTILEQLAKRDPNVQLSISLTTRAARDWEIDGFHYYFVTKDYFLNKLERQEILEYAQYGEQYYGTPRDPVDQWLEEGKTVILKIEVQGAEKIRRLYPDVVSIFLMPPSMQTLEERLRNRESECEKDIKTRMRIAQDEIGRAHEYDYVVVNDTVDYAVSDICAIIQAENLKAARMNSFVKEVLEHV